MLKSRIITALILIPLVIAALFMLPPLPFAIVIIAVCMLAAWEWGQFLGFKTAAFRIPLAVLCGIGLGALYWPVYASGMPPLANPVVDAFLLASLGWWALALLMVLSYPSSARFWQKSPLLRLMFGVLTIVPFFFGMIALRQHGLQENAYTGAWWLLYVMVLVWGADSGAYAFGRLFGKHKLAPKVSPGKTLEGLIGGLVTSALIAWLFSLFVPLHISLNTLLICSVLAVLASVLGDLTESMFKRESGIKDSSQLIPGHGGVLDRIDSLTAAIPVFACLIFLIF
ncbi:phosphatidate cytidylyltransferase [Leminorella grimontii]|uniref:Phosphatidate cytidylyltransferase n=1 Tax=Leminorella grimontii TaxID=82981 RepID=A0AAV5MZP7_9GAMM|nr:phosphatidate cytidylyltransferase [Leminorella grimontii]KFC97316.1 phosphatidate cytidylyltransferase [Leminorella grimontii ATCC 33999 = DSM 5078]GKX55331.1 phosphatidate cytidylyltransferase [Leminorella grimontii]GKX58749.1 phosphatidate cytidylyltransferase [Leminorella grimontii]